VSLALASTVFERNVYTYRRQWVALLTGFFEPVFYLLSLGLGLGALVGSVHTDGGTSVSYAQFVAPAMLATSAMNGAIFDATYNMFFKLKYARTFEAMLATPIGPRDIAIGEVAWSMVRVGIYATGFIMLSVALGLVLSWWALLALPVALLVGMSFSAVGMAATTWIRGFADFDYIQLAIVPLFLLSATFYPVSTYPSSLRWVVELSPLYHGVAIERALFLGDVSWGLLAHVAVLVALAAAGVVVTRRRLAALLLR
jgi:lipooligosaccharide transport system permease protein